jgi:hypothetical protein
MEWDQRDQQAEMVRGPCHIEGCARAYGEVRRRQDVLDVAIVAAQVAGRHAGPHIRCRTVPKIQVAADDSRLVPMRAPLRGDRHVQQVATLGERDRLVGVGQVCGAGVHGGGDPDTQPHSQLGIAGVLSGIDPAPRHV